MHDRRETYLFELVHTEDASGVPTMGPYLLAEARGVPNVAFRKFLWFHPLLPGGQNITNRWLEHCQLKLGGLGLITNNCWFFNFPSTFFILLLVWKYSLQLLMSICNQQ